jgi:hypothetical protein
MEPHLTVNSVLRRVCESALRWCCFCLLLTLGCTHSLSGDDFQNYLVDLRKRGIDLECSDNELSTRCWRRWEWNIDSCNGDLPDATNINSASVFDGTIDEHFQTHASGPDGFIVSEDAVRKLFKFPKIYEVSITTNISADLLALIATLPELRSVNLGECEILSKDHLHSLENAKHLRTLSIWGHSFPSPDQPFLSGLAKLKSLDCLRMDYRFCGSALQTQQLCDELAQLSRLRILLLDMGKMKYPPDFNRLKDLGELTAVSTPMNDSGMVLPELAKLPHLKELRLQPIATRQGSISEMLAKEPEEIILSRSIANLNDSFGAIAELSSLESLTLDLTLCQECDRFTGITDISRIPRLRLLELKSGDQLTGAVLANLTSNSLKEVRIDDCIHFSDQGLINLAKGTNLKTLTLMNCLEISDEGIRALEKMTSLERLEIEYEGGPKPEGLTVEGLRSLKEKLPKCFISLRHFSKETGMLVDVVSLK